jgi:hypothetical protein
LNTYMPMADLAARWGITANTVSRRLSFLGIKPIRQGNYRFITAEQLALGDELQQHVLSGKPMEWFGSLKIKSFYRLSRRQRCRIIRQEMKHRVSQAIKPKNSSWGNWVFTDNLCLLWKGWYEIDLEQINTTAKLCDWIFHCWHRDGADLVQAFRDIFEPCANCCSMGVEREFSGSKLASVYAARLKPPVNKSPVPPKVRYEILRRDNFCCQACGAKASADNPLHVDHITPRKHGGTNDPSNLQVLCATCNLGKGASL